MTTTHVMLDQRLRGCSDITTALIRHLEFSEVVVLHTCGVKYIIYGVMYIK